MNRLRLYIYRSILNKINDTGLSLKLEYRFGLIDTDGSPKTCRFCGGKDFREQITDRIEGMVLEKNSFCSKCNSICGYWVTGAWMP